MWFDCMSMGGFRFFPLLIILLILFSVYSIFFKNKDKTNSNLDTLNSRYANGEITKGEYDAIKKDIL